MSDILLNLTFAALLAGAFLGAMIGAWYARRKVYDLGDFLHPEAYRAWRGALIGFIFGAFVGPKLMLIGYITSLLLR